MGIPGDHGSAPLPTAEVAGRATPAGTTFALLPAAAGSAAPTLLLLAMSASDTLTALPYGRVGHLLWAKGWNVVSLDLPCHGADRRAHEPAELRGWAARSAAGEDIVAPFQARVDDVLRHLVATGTADPARLAAAGTSRGGFMALHAAAGNPCLRAVAAFAPVTDLLALDELSGLQTDSLAQGLALPRRCEALADRAVWVTIGDHDARVGTERVVAFVRGLEQQAAARGRPSQAWLRVLPVPGHTSLAEWHDQAAAWLLERLAPGPGPLP